MSQSLVRHFSFRHTATTSSGMSRRRWHQFVVDARCRVLAAGNRRHTDAAILLASWSHHHPSQRYRRRRRRRSVGYACKVASFTGNSATVRTIVNAKQQGLVVASMARDVGSSSTNRSSDIMRFLPRSLKKTLQHKPLNNNKAVTCFRSRLWVSKLSDIATITNFSIHSLFHQKFRHHPIRRSGWGVVSKYLAKTSIYPSMQRYPGSILPCDHNAQTSQTDGQTDGHMTS